MLTVEQVMAAHKANVETLMGLSGKAFDGMEKLLALNLSTGKALLADAAAQAQSALAVKDAQELLSLQTTLLQPIREKAASYGRDLYEIASVTSAEFSKAFEAQLAATQQKFMEVVESTAQHAPAGSEAAVALMKSAVMAANNALETAQKSAKQAMTMAEANFKAAVASAVDASKSDAKKR